jgi:two-component system heavy metal sensor histidine kinase CusS
VHLLLRGRRSELPAGAFSITARLVLLYSCSAFGVLLVSCLFLYETLTINLDRERMQFLADEVTTLRQIQVGHPEADGSLQEEVQFESDVRRFSRYYVRISARGEPLIETMGMAEILPVNVFPLAIPEQAEPTRASSYVAADGRQFLLLSAWAQSSAPVGGRREMQIAIDNSGRELIRGNYRRSMAWTVLLGTLSSALAASAIARRGMRPLHEIASRARGISASQLHERIRSSRWPAELVDVASAFDEMLERLERSFTQLSQFSADLAHELRTPINNLMGEAEVALRRARSGAEYARMIESSLEELGRVSGMIDSMLFLARAEGAETPLQLATLELSRELEVVREFYDALAEQRGVSVSCSGGGTLRADPSLLRRAIGNLLSNALEHTPAGGHIGLCAQAGPSSVEVQVQDTGCGVEAEHLPRLFDRFYRVDRARSGERRGTGLGLALVKSIVELHGGSASIRSIPGLGTSVLLHFPVASSPAADASPLRGVMP